MNRKSFTLLASVGLAGLLQGQTSSLIPVDLELSLVLDASTSVNDVEWRQQVQGYAAAFRNTELQQLIKQGEIGSIAVNAIAFQRANSGITSGARVLINFQKIDSATDARTLANMFAGLPRPARNGSPSTFINSGIHTAAQTLTTNNFAGKRLVIDVSGDGTQSNGNLLVSGARDRALNLGVDTINGIVIDSGNNVFNHYRDHVIGGRDPFVVKVRRFADFEDAIVTKIAREIIPREEGEQELRARYVEEKTGNGAVSAPFDKCVVLEFDAVRGIRYELQFSSTLSEPSWQTIYTSPQSSRLVEQRTHVHFFPSDGSQEQTKFFRLKTDGSASKPLVVRRVKLEGNDYFNLVGQVGHDSPVTQGRLEGTMEGDNILRDDTGSFLAKLNPSQHYTLEILSGDLKGLVQEVTSFTNTTLTVGDDIGSGQDLNGVQYRIRPTRTINDFLGADNRFNLPAGPQGAELFIPLGDGSFNIATYNVPTFGSPRWLVQGEPVVTDAGIAPWVMTDGLLIRIPGAASHEIVSLGEIREGTIAFQPTSQYSYLNNPNAASLTLAASRLDKTIQQRFLLSFSDQLWFPIEGSWSVQSHIYDKYAFLKPSVFSPSQGDVSRWVKAKSMNSDTEVDPQGVGFPNSFIVSRSLTGRPGEPNGLLVIE